MRLVRRLAALALASLVSATSALAQKYQPEDPIPPGAKGKILPVTGKVLEIEGLATEKAAPAESARTPGRKPDGADEKAARK